MTRRGFINGAANALRVGACMLFFAFMTSAGPAFAETLMPDNFFDRIPETPSGKAGIEADQLFFNSDTGIITASGNVGMSYVGYYATADRMVFNQKTRELLLEGDVHIIDPDGIEYTADRVEVTDGFKNAVLNAMVMLSPDGSLITGTEVRKIRGEITETDNGTYAPCGTCTDAKGRRIGWRIRTEKIVQHTVEEYDDLTQPVLEVLGYPIAWLPWIRVPDFANDEATGLRMPSLAFTEKVGAKLSVPYYYSLGQGVGLLLTPSLISRQGLLLGATFSQRFKGLGSYSVALHGIYQLNPSAFTAGYGDTDLRGALQTSGTFTPVDRWTLGWSYTSFTDPAFLTNYMITTDNPVVNEAYANYLSPSTYGDVRIQDFRLLGEVSDAAQDQQAALLPKLRVDHVEELGENGGTLHLKGDAIGGFACGGSGLVQRHFLPARHAGVQIPCHDRSRLGQAVRSGVRHGDAAGRVAARLCHL